MKDLKGYAAGMIDIQEDALQNAIDAEAWEEVSKLAAQLEGMQEIYLYWCMEEKYDTIGE